jgi:hypothetical protein
MKQSTYGAPGTTRPEYCEFHKPADYIDVIVATKRKRTQPNADDSPPVVSRQKMSVAFLLC